MFNFDCRKHYASAKHEDGNYIFAEADVNYNMDGAGIEINAWNNITKEKETLLIPSKSVICVGINR